MEIRKQGCNIKFDEFHSDCPGVFAKRRNIIKFVDAAEEEKECDREVEECATIKEDKKHNNTQLKTKNIFPICLIMLFG